MTRVEIDPATKRFVSSWRIVAGELDTLTQAFRMAVAIRVMSDSRRGWIFTRRRREFTYPEVWLRMR